jgi:stress-induced-phosphoprotein 1
MTQLQQNPDLVMQYMQAQDRQVMEAVSLLMQIKNYDPEKEARQKAEKEEADRIRKKKWEEKRAAEKKAKEEAEEAARRAAETPEERAAREKKELAEATKQEGNGHYKKREFAEALDKYADALELDPSNMSISTNRAAVFYEMKDYDKCLEECDKAIEIGRKYFCKFTLIAKAFARKGNAYMKKNMLDEAIENFENAQMESRTDAVKQKLKKCYKQKKLVEDAAYLNPEEGLKAKERGNELFKKGDFPGAIKEYSDAIKRDPESHVYYANRAAAY